VYPLISFWNEFKREFIRELNELSDEEYQYAWRRRKNRTILYEDTIIPKISKSLNLNYKKEDFKIDYTLCVENDGHEVPLIFIESENVANSAHHEIRKLCCLSAPLKVLIVCAEWSDEPGAWRHGGDKCKLIERWSSQIKAHNKVWPMPAVTGVIVAEWNSSLKYYSLAFDHLGDIVDNHEIMFSREIS